MAKAQQTTLVWNSGRLAPIIHLGLLNSGFRFRALYGMLPLLSTWLGDIRDFDVSR
jgi:hypothetical protein